MKNNYLTKIMICLLAFFGSKATAQDLYTVAPIPSQVYTATQPVAFTADDTYSAVIGLPFDFTFFGTSYSQINVSTNGYMEFGGTHILNEYSPWAFNATIPNANFPVKNSFLGCYHDMNNSNAQGTITYGITGEAPYRKFIVIFNNNSHFQCDNLKSSFQMVLYETLNIMDSQIIKKELCSQWNGGAAVIGVINADGLLANTPPNRNTGAWAANNEGWRFLPLDATMSDYSFVKCDANGDGFETFDLQVAQNDLSATPANITFYLSYDDAQNQQNPLPLSYANATASSQTIWSRNAADGFVYAVSLKTVDCDNDFDADSVATADEDLNNDTNLANDDTDNDGIPDFVDNDDDGDLILTNEEYVFARSASAILDTDSDGIPNYLDNDDDGDSVLTVNEDYNGNNNPLDDDTNDDGVPDYLQSSVALGVNQKALQAKSISIYPNPASDILNVDNKTGQAISEIALYSINGMLVKQTRNTQALTAISVSDLESGIYFVKILIGSEVQNYKFIKK